VSNPRRLLVITYDFGPSGPVGGLRWAGIAKYLTRLGWNIAVVTAAPAYGRTAAVDAQVEWCPRLWTLGDGYRLLRSRIFGESLGSSSNGGRVTPPEWPRGLLRRLGNEVATFLAFPDEGHGWMLRAALRARSVIRRFQPQVVVSSGPPHSAHLVAGMATIGSSARWLIDLRDPWAGPIPKVWQSHRRIGTRVFRTLVPPLERLAFRAADGVITNTPQLADVLAAKYPDVPFVCVPNGVDPDGVPPPARRQYPGLGIAYTGRLYAGRDLGPVMGALRIFFDRHPEAAQAGSKLRIAGDADARHAQVFHDAVAVAGAEQYVEVLGLLPRAEALDVVSRSRLAVVLAQDQALQIPAKLYESVAMGVPTLVVAPAGSAAAVEGNRLGAVVRDSGDVDGIACVLEHLWRDGAGARSPCPVPITYDAIAALVDQVLGVRLPPPAARPAGASSV
jgi:Glycosyltransferase Family 4/Glycosyl transferases group 1